MDTRYLSQQQRIEQLETCVGKLYVALSKFAQPRSWFHRGGQTVYLVTEEEQQEARRARMYALHVMAETGTPPPTIAFGVPTVPLFGSRYTSPNLGGGPNSRPSGGPVIERPPLSPDEHPSDPRTPRY